MSVFTNFYPREGRVDTTEKVITFPIKIKRVIISNGSSSVELHFKFNETEDYGHLGTNETFSCEISTYNIYIKTAKKEVKYKVWGYG